MWSPAVAAVRVKEIPCVYAPVNVKNGKKISRLVQRHGFDEAPVRQEARCRLRISQLYLSAGRAASSDATAYYSPVPSTAKKFLTARMDFWYDGKPAPSVINDPYGVRWKRPVPSGMAAPSSSASRISPAGIRLMTRPPT